MVLPLFFIIFNLTIFDVAIFNVAIFDVTMISGNQVIIGTSSHWHIEKSTHLCVTLAPT